MKFVIDTNILFTFFWQNSSTKKLIQDKKIELFSPLFALHELSNYKSEIMQKTKITKEEFTILFNDLKKYVSFIPSKEYKSYQEQAKSLSPDKDDVDFIALALCYKCPLWSNDKDLKNIDEHTILTTKEIILLLS